MGWEINFGAISKYTIPVLIFSHLFNGFVMEDQWPGLKKVKSLTSIQ
jgi:hypothetical protein